MSAIVVIICTLVGAQEAYAIAQANIRLPVPSQCLTLIEPMRLPIDGVVAGPAADRDGDPVWIVRLKGQAYTLVWADPRGRAL